MEQQLLKRFVREIKQDPSLYTYYLNSYSPMVLEEYLMFLRKQSKNNFSFAKALKRYHLIKESDHLLETVAHDEYSVTSYLDHSDSTIIQSEYGKLVIRQELDPNLQLDHNTCYISNGIYRDTEALVHHLARGGSFVVGVCDNEDSLFFKENIEALKELEKIIKKRNHFEIKKVKHKQHRDTFYALYHREGNEQ